MQRGHLGAVARGFERLFGGHATVAGLGEGALLQRFVASRDEAAFEALVARHGPMVVGVSRRLLEDPRDVEDAFQAVFLVLVRRAGAIRDADRLGPWLYGVTLKVARRSRQQAARRRAREKGGDAVTACEPVGGGPPNDLGPELHEELGRLPARYRDPIVLCDLEGRTHEEAARLLHWPLGTVKGRLSRARELLRGRLVRRGLAPSMGLFLFALQHDAKAAVPVVLLDNTVRAAMGLAAGTGVAALAGSVSVPALGLADGVVSTMILTKLKTAAVALALTGALATGTAALAFPRGSATQGAGVATGGSATFELQGETGEGKLETKPTDEIEAARRALQAARLGKLREKFDEAVRDVGSSEDLDQPRSLSIDLLKEAFLAARSPAEALAAVEAHAQRMDEMAKRLAARGEGLSSIPRSAIEVLVAEARLWVAEEKASRPLSGDLTGAARGYELTAMAAGARMGAGASDRGGMPFGPGMMGGGMAGMGSGMGGGGMGGMGVGRWSGGGGGGTPPSAILQAQANDPKNRAIVAVLEQPLAMPFPQPTPLEDVLKYIKNATETPELPGGLPIYVDPAPDGENDQPPLQHQVTMNLDGVRLKTTFRLLLKQAHLGYLVKDGLIYIGRLDSRSFDSESETSQPAGGAVPGYGEMPPLPGIGGRAMGAGGSGFGGGIGGAGDAGGAPPGGGQAPREGSHDPAP